MDPCFLCTPIIQETSFHRREYVLVCLQVLDEPSLDEYVRGDWMLRQMSTVPILHLILGMFCLLPHFANVNKHLRFHKVSAHKNRAKHLVQIFQWIFFFQALIFSPMNASQGVAHCDLYNVHS